MGLCVDIDETPHGMSFEVRRESVIFDCVDGGGATEPLEIGKADLLKIKGLLCDPDWSRRLLPPNDRAHRTGARNDGGSNG